MDKVAVCVYVCHSYSTGWKKDPGTRRVNVTFGDPHTGTHLVIRLGWIQEMEEKEPTQPQSTTCSSPKRGSGCWGHTERGEERKSEGCDHKRDFFSRTIFGEAFQTVAVLLALVRKRITGTARPALPLSDESRRLALTPQALVGEGTEKKAASLRGSCNC